MSMTKTIGGDRLGSGKKMKVELHGYERSTHDMGYLWRSTMAAGTLIPFMSEIALPGDTWDIHLEADIKTHPTVGPLFGSFKVQLDIFQAPIRLYQAQLHNNKLGIGMNMSTVKLPLMNLFVDQNLTIPNEDPDNAQISPSCILSYLGIRGIGYVDPTEADTPTRQFQAIPLLAYWDIYKNYYANKQETNGWVIHEARITLIETVTNLTIGGATIPGTLPAPFEGLPIQVGNEVVITFPVGPTPLLNQIIFYTNQGQIVANAAIDGAQTTTTEIRGYWSQRAGNLIVYYWTYLTGANLPIQEPTPTLFALENIDTMRESIMADIANANAFVLNPAELAPYSYLLNWAGGVSPYLNSQEGLGLKTYQSDLFNNWLNTETIDGTNGIAEITAIDTSLGSFTIDTLNLSKKVYDMLNRIAISGGTYDDWLDVTYDHDRYIKCETPIYHGGLIRELVFQEVISNSDSGDTPSQNTQPLGTLAGKGVMASKRKGGEIYIKVDEPSYIMGIISLTPRIDYSQGNKWDTSLRTMDDLHKPALDEIGFQDLITEQMAWWSTEKTLDQNTWVQKSAGKQPAWLNYMTNVNQTRGNFAIKDNEMFMTLNRRYEKSGTTGIADLTTYIDPVKFNQIFAETSIDAQNYWAQIAVDITARRKISAKIMPNL